MVHLVAIAIYFQSYSHLLLVQPRHCCTAWLGFEMTMAWCWDAGCITLLGYTASLCHISVAWRGCLLLLFGSLLMIFGPFQTWDCYVQLQLLRVLRLTRSTIRLTVRSDSPNWLASSACGNTCSPRIAVPPNWACVTHWETNDIPIEWQLLMAYMVINSWSTMRVCNRSCFLFPTQHLAGLRYCALTSWPPKHKSLPSEKRHLYTLLIMAMGECQIPDIATSSHVYIYIFIYLYRITYVYHYSMYSQS